MLLAQAVDTMLKIYDVRHILGDSSFLLDDGKTSILYDTGFAFTGNQVAKNIKNILGDRSLDYIFLTHSHYDHALGSVYVKKLYPSVKIVAGEYATKIFLKDSAKQLMRDLDKKFAKTCGVEDYEDLIDNLIVDIAVADGDQIKAGDMTFTAVSFPGHTKCSIGYYLNSEKLLLGSETLGVYTGDSILPSYLVGYQMALNSIEKAKALDIENILAPHYGVLDKEQTKKYLQDAKTNAIQTANGILNILKSGGSDQDAIDYFMNKYYKGYAKEIYPIDAITLNTTIMVNLLKREFLEN